MAFLGQPGSVYAWSFCDSKVVLDGFKMVFIGSKMVFDQSILLDKQNLLDMGKKYVVNINMFLSSQKSFVSVPKVFGPIQNNFEPKEETRH